MWKEKQIFAIGGLLEIGFYNNSDFLMVLSSAGRGIFDCLNLIRVERDYSDYYYESWNSLTGIVKGIGFLDGEDIICGGFDAEDPLNKTTLDGWELKIEKEIKKDWQGKRKEAEVLYLVKNTEKILAYVFFYGIDRAYGFSNTGKSFVIATSSEIIVWNRK